MQEELNLLSSGAALEELCRWGIASSHSSNGWESITPVPKHVLQPLIIQTGWHRHTALVLAAGAFLSVLRSQVEPLPQLSIPPLFSAPIGAGSLVAFKAARGLSSGLASPN